MSSPRLGSLLEKTESTRSSMLRHVGRWLLDVLRPDILTRGPRKELSVTSYLDGLRGFAAFLVYWQHNEVWAHMQDNSEVIFANSYGWEGKYYFATLPGIRLLFTGGHIAVSVFFVISGHVLSAKPMALIRGREFQKLEDNLSSALFRRWLRLYLPAAAVTFLYMTSWHAFGLWTAYPPHEKNYYDEIINWYWRFKDFSWIFRGGNSLFINYNVHLWSIAVEMRGSIAIFTALMAFSRCTRNARLLCQVGLIFYLLCLVDGMLYALFIGGMLIGELDLLARHNELPQFFYTYLEPYKKRIYYTLFIIAIYLSGVPSWGADQKIMLENPGWVWLAHLKPKTVSASDHKWFYLFFASTFIVAAIPRINWLKKFFETRFCQYLGRISFALYLVHGPILWTIGDRIYLAVGWTRDRNAEGLQDWFNLMPLSKAGPLGLEPGFLLPHLIILPLTFWFAEICTRAFDKPSIKFAQWAYRQVLPGGTLK